jgi:hypothetical protein
MCFSASVVIDGPAVNGLLLIVEVFAMFFWPLLPYTFPARRSKLLM